jgi:flagellar hook assembly protein FlgD
LVKVLHKGSLKAGQYSFDWNLTDEAGKKVGNGVYIYRLTGNGNTVSNKVVVSR